MKTDNKPVVLINIITPKPGKIDEVVELQREAQKNFKGIPTGWRGSRLHRSVDDKTVAMVIVFESIEHHKQWLQNEKFIKHRDALLQLVEKIEVNYYDIVSEAGRIQD